MRSRTASIVVLAMTAGLTGCTGGSTKADHRVGKAPRRDCFEVWNAESNKARQAIVAGRFSIANVSHWVAQASGGVNLGGPASQGCGYLFHDDARYVSINGAWKGKTIRWGVPPSQHGAWSAEQHTAVYDNAAVEADGRLRHREHG